MVDNLLRQSMLQRCDESLEMLLQVRKYADSVGVGLVNVDGVRFFVTDWKSWRVYVCPATQRFGIADDVDGVVGAAFSELDGIRSWCLFDVVSIAGEIVAKTAGVEDPAKGGEG